MAIYIGRAYTIDPSTGLIDSLPKYVRLSHNERRLQAELQGMAGVKKVDIGIIIDRSFQSRILVEGLV